MEENREEDETEEELAVRGFMLELVRSALLIARVNEELRDRRHGAIHAGDTGEVAVLRQMIETALPHLREAGGGTCRLAALLIEQVRSEIVRDFQLSSQSDDHRN